MPKAPPASPVGVLSTPTLPNVTKMGSAHARLGSKDLNVMLVLTCTTTFQLDARHAHVTTQTATVFSVCVLTSPLCVQQTWWTIPKLSL